MSDFVIKAVIDRANRLVPLACKEVEDENDDELEVDWGSGGRELRPTIAGIVCVKAIDQSGQHCYAPLTFTVPFGRIEKYGETRAVKLFN